MGPESADMLDHVTLEVSSNSNNPELGWKSITKGKRSNKTVARNVNGITKVDSRSPKKPGGSVTRKLVSNGADHIPLKKRRVLRTPSGPQSSPLVKEEPSSPQPQTPSPHGDSKPQSKVFCKSSAENSIYDRVDRAGVSEDQDQKSYNPDHFSGIELLAAAAGMDIMDDDSSHFEVINEHSIPEKAGISASREPIKCSIPIEPQSSPSDMVKEFTDAKCSSLDDGAAIPQSMQVNEDVAVRELEVLKVDRLHWDLNIEMDAWEQPLDTSDHNLQVQKMEGEGCEVSAKSDYYHITENHRHVAQIEQVSSGPANVTDRASVAISALDVCPTKSMNVSGQKLSSSLGSVVQSDQISCVYVDGEPPGTASENIPIVRETAKVINQTTPFTDTEDSIQHIELAVLESSQHENNINGVVVAVVEDRSCLPDNSGNNSPTKPAQFLPNYKDVSTSGASTDSGLFNPDGQASSIFIPDTSVIEGVLLPSLSTKDDGSQSYDPTGSSGKVGSSLDDCRCSDVSQGDGSNTVGSKDMTGAQDGSDSSYEDGELRLSMPYPWLETDLDHGYNECADYESDGADYPGPEVVETGFDGSLDVEKRSLSVREASVPELNKSRLPKVYMKEDVELGGTSDKSKVEYYMRDNNLRRRPFNHSDGIETHRSHLEEVNSRTNRMKSHSHFEGSECLDVMEKTNTGYQQQNNRSHIYSRPVRDVNPHKFMSRQRSNFHARERDGGDNQWSGQWESRSRISSDFHGPASHSYDRPRNMTAKSEKFSEFNSQDQRKSMHYSSKAPFRVDNRRFPYERNDDYRVRNRTAANPNNRIMGNSGDYTQGVRTAAIIDNRSMGYSGNHAQGVSRGNRHDSYDPSNENRTLSPNRIPHYLPRPEPSYSPPSARPSLRVSQNFIPRKRFHSRSRSRSPPHGDRRYTRSSDFRSSVRVDRERKPFQKPNFPADHPGSGRGHFSPQRNHRWVDDRNFVENSGNRSSPVSASERIHRFNSVGSDGRHKEDNYFRPGNRPGRFPPIGGAGRGCNFGEKYDDRRDDRVDGMHLARHSDANVAVGRCKDDQKTNFSGIMQKDDDIRNTEHRDVARSSHEDRRPFKE